MTIRRSAARVLAVMALLGAGAAVAQEVRFAFAAYACDGEAFTRNDTPLILQGMSIRWFDTDCTIVSNYKVAQALFLQARCTAQGKTSTIPIMLELKGDRLRVGWNRERIVEMQRCQ